MSFVHDGSNYLISLEPNGVKSPEIVDVSYISPQPVNVLAIKPRKYPSSHSSSTHKNKENKLNCNVSWKMTTKKPTWAPGKPLSPKAQEIIKSGKGRPSDVPPFKWICLTCNRCLRDEWGLEQHIQTVHGARTFACPHNCNKIFKRKDHLSMHVMTIHEGRKPCKTCKGTVTFKSKEELHQHKLQIHGPATGPLKQGSSSKLPPYKCASCDFHTERKENMDDHTNTAHLQKPFAPAVKSALRCEQCAWNFSSQYYHKLHLQQVHGITNPIEDPTGNVSPVNTGNTNSTSEYLLPTSSQLNNIEPKMEINNHEDIIQEVMGHDIFKGLQGDLLDDSLSRYSNQPTDNSSMSVLPHLESQQSQHFESPNVYMNFQDISGHYNTPSGTTVQPSHDTEVANFDNLGTSIDLNLCDMKSVGITY